jgi:hypothetical protein
MLSSTPSRSSPTFIPMIKIFQPVLYRPVCSRRVNAFHSVSFRTYKVGSFFRGFSVGSRPGSCRTNACFHTKCAVGRLHVEALQTSAFLCAPMGCQPSQGTRVSILSTYQIHMQLKLKFPLRSVGPKSRHRNTMVRNL